ncbi:MAG: hypothetical protein J6E40_06590 [Lachnospiraceae bacterium]|nr:hypothetical protein [Lachnospiraceae bacterium]
MKEFTIKPKEADYFKLNIGAESYLIPLAKSLTLEEINSIKTKKDIVTFFEKHLGEEVFNALTVDQFEEVCREWQKANDLTEDGEDEAISMGES